MEDIFAELKRDAIQEKDEEDSGGSDSEAGADDLNDNELNKLHENMLFIIENFNKPLNSRLTKPKIVKEKPKVKKPSAKNNIIS